MKIRGLAMLSMCLTLGTTVTGCSKAPDATAQVDYLGPAAKAAKAKRNTDTIPASMMEARQTPPDDVKGGTMYDWITVRGPNGQHALIGTHLNVIATMVVDPKDRGHFLNILYKGDCRTGWTVHPRANVLNTFAGKDKQARQIDTPPVPWLDASLAKTCSDTVPVRHVTDHEAMWLVMTGQA